MVQVGEPWMPSLCSMPAQKTRCARQAAVVIDQEFRHQEQRNAARAGRRIGQPRQHEMDDVVGEIVLAIGDEDLLAEDAVGAVAGRLGAGAQARRGRSRPAARSGSSCPSIRRRPAWPDSSPSVPREACLSSASTAPMVSVGPMPKAMAPSSTFRARRRRAWAAGPGRHIFRPGQRVPAAVDPAAIELLPAGRGGDRRVLQHRACSSPTL